MEWFREESKDSVTSKSKRSMKNLYVTVEIIDVNV